MADVIPCPEPEILDDLLANRLPAAGAEQIRAHLAGCAKCQSRLRGSTPAPPPAPVRTPPARFPFLRPPVEPNELGRLGEYRIVGLLGEGGMSLVFDAEEPVLHRKIALKVLRPEHNNGTTRERFLREARALASLPPQHVVHVYSVGEENGIPYMAMERLLGESLDARLKRDRWLPVADALRFARESAEGLVVLHERGLIHRDIKPDNLWLETGPTGRFEGVKLIDFGIARMASGDSGLTLPGQVIGTPVYMSPEQAAGQPVDGRTDLYSLGCVLYRMVTGLTPFDASGPKTMLVLEAVIKGNAPKIRDAAPHLSPPVAELIQQMMERDPNKRPSPASVVVERLRRLEEEQRNSSSSTRVITASQTSTGRAPRKAGLLGLILGGVAVLAAVVVVVWTLVVQYSSPPTKPDRSSEYRIGVLFSEQGTTAPLELPMIDAIQLAVDEINREGGVLGRELRLIHADGHSQERVFAEKAVELIESEQVEMIVGCWTSGSRKRVGEVCRERDRLLFYPVSDEGLELSPNVIHLGGTANQTAVPLIRHAHGELGKRRFYLVGSEALYSHGMNAIFRHEIENRPGAKVVGTRYLLLGETNVQSVIDEIRRSKADFVVSTIDGSTNQAFFLAMRQAKLSAKDGVPTAWAVISETELIQYSQEGVLGDFATGGYFESIATPANKAFLERFRKRYGQTKRVNDSMQSAYSAVYLWKKAVEKAKSTDTSKVREALRGMTIDTPDGPMKIDEQTLYAWRTGRVSKVVRGKTRLGFDVEYSTPSLVRPEPFPAWQTREQWKEFLDRLYAGWGDAWEKHK